MTADGGVSTFFDIDSSEISTDAGCTESIKRISTNLENIQAKRIRLSRKIQKGSGKKLEPEPEKKSTKWG